MKTAAALILAVLALPVSAKDISRDDLEKALKANPDLVIEALRGQKKQLFELVNEAAQEEQLRRQKEEAEREKKEFEESFKNPLKAVIDENSLIRGKKDAKYTLVEYSDFQCPYCVRGFQTVEALRKKLGDDLRFVFKHLPLDFHPQAMPAAIFIEAAKLQSHEKAWKAHDIFFQNQAKLGEDFYQKTAKELALDIERFKKDINSDAVKARVAADTEEAHKLGFSGTPGFLFNGIPVRGAYPVEHFEGVIKRIEAQGK